MGRDYNRHFRMNQLNEFRRSALCRRTKCKPDNSIEAAIEQIRQRFDTLADDRLAEVLKQLVGD